MDPVCQRFCLPKKWHLINKLFSAVKVKYVFNAGQSVIDLGPLICWFFIKLSSTHKDVRGKWVKQTHSTQLLQFEKIASIGYSIIVYFIFSKMYDTLFFTPIFAL